MPKDYKIKRTCPRCGIEFQTTFSKVIFKEPKHYGCFPFPQYEERNARLICPNCDNNFHDSELTTIKKVK